MSVDGPLDLLVIGAGHLGARVARAWRSSHPSAAVRAETLTPRRHAELAAAGVGPRSRSDEAPPPAANLLFSLPPSAVDDYAAEAHRAVAAWTGAGRLLMTSSTAVYAENDGGLCVEASPVADTPRAARLLAAEAAVLAAGGIVLRLAGLYDEERGPQHVFLRQPTSERRPDGLLNLIHYDDAASLCSRALAAGRSGEIYLGCDGAPISRDALVTAAWEAVQRDAATDGAPSRQRCRFTGEDGPLGRRCDNGSTRRALDWEPLYGSFVAWSASRTAP